MTDAPAVPDDLRAYVARMATGSPLRTVRIDWRGRAIWIKKAIPDKATKWKGVQRFLAHVADMPMLLASSSPGGAEGLRIEALRIREVRRAGFPAPEVLGLTEDWILLEDLGEMVETKLRYDPTLTPGAVADIVVKCGEAIARLHEAGLAHGRSKLKDLVLMKNGTIGFIDFEEDILTGGVSLPGLQARDLWLLLCSVARFEPRCPGLVETVYEKYFAIHDCNDTRAALRGLLRLLSPLRHITGSLRRQFNGKMQRVCFTTSTLLRISSLN